MNTKDQKEKNHKSAEKFPCKLMFSETMLKCAIIQGTSYQVIHDFRKYGRRVESFPAGSMYRIITIEKQGFQIDVNIFESNPDFAYEMI